MRIAPLLPLTALLVACSGVGIGPPTPGRYLGIIRYFGDSAVLTAPDTVLSGASFVASIRTFGGGCSQKGDTELTLSGTTAELRPYDTSASTTAGTVCPSILYFLSHEVTLRAGSPGEMTVSAVGREEPGDSVVRVSRRVVVR